MRIIGLTNANRENSPTLVGWQLAQRIQLILGQVAKQKAGASEVEIAHALNIRLRRFGIVLTPSELQEHAARISATPG